LTVHAQNLSSLRHVAIGVLKAAADVAAFKLAAVLAKVGSKRNCKSTFRVVTRGGTSLLCAWNYFIRQVLCAQLFAFSHDRSAIDRVLQFTHVAGPTIVNQSAQRTLSDLSQRQVVTLRGSLGKRFGKLRYVLTTLAQRRDVDGHHSQSIKKICAKIAGSDFL